MIWLALLLGLVAGFLYGWWLRGAFEHAPAEPPPVHPRSVAARSQAEQEAERIIEQLL